MLGGGGGQNARWNLFSDFLPLHEGLVRFYWARCQTICNFGRARALTPIRVNRAGFLQGIRLIIGNWGLKFYFQGQSNIWPSNRAFLAQHMRPQTYGVKLGWVKSSKTLFLTSPQITYILIYNMCKCDGMTCMQHARMLRAPSLLRLNSFQEITWVTKIINN